MQTLVSLDAPPALVSSTVGFGSSGSPAPLPSNSGGVGLTLQLKPKGSSQPIFAPPSSGAAKLGEKLRSSLPVLPLPKPFQKYYRKAREGCSVQLNEDFLAKSLATMRTPVNFTAKEAVAAPPVKISAGMTNYVKKGFLRKGFLNPCPALIVSTPHSSLVESVVASSSQEVKDDGVIGISSPLSGRVSPLLEEGNEVRVNGLSQSQKWPIGFDLSREVVVWEQDGEIWDGEAGDSTYPFSVLPPNMALDWEMDSAEGEDPSLAIMNAFE